MKRLLVTMLAMTGFFAYGQGSSTSFDVKHIDSVVLAMAKQKNFLLSECDSIADMNGNKVYKCWNYYFRGAGKKDVSKVSISFNNLPEELCFYHEKNIVIKREAYIIIRGHSKLIWAIFFKNDKEIFYKDKDPEREGYDKIEQGYYFLDLANEYSTKTASR